MQFLGKELSVDPDCPGRTQKIGKSFEGWSGGEGEPQENHLPLRKTGDNKS